MSAKRFRGKVVSNKMNKTIVVAVEMPKRHPIYDKIIKNTRRFKVRNELEATLGSEVIIEECKPFSKECTWKVVEVVSSSKEK